MISEQTYKANYWMSDMIGDTVYMARPAKLCDTKDLVREYFELEAMFEDGVGDSEKIEKRMEEINKEMIGRDTGRLVWKKGG